MCLLFLFIYFFFRNFSCTETLCSEQKYFCETCGSKQEAQKRFAHYFYIFFLLRIIKYFIFRLSPGFYVKLQYTVLVSATTFTVMFSKQNKTKKTNIFPSTILSSNQQNTLTLNEKHIMFTYFSSIG